MTTHYGNKGSGTPIAVTLVKMPDGRRLVGIDTGDGHGFAINATAAESLAKALIAVAKEIKGQI